MSLCLALARKGAGHVSPNPLVGCVIVKRGTVLAEGYHRRVGGPHAEIEVLKKVKFKAKGATLYCNLEPCFHHGRTPPCVHRVIDSGVSRVVIAHRDPHSKVAGKSIRLLKRAGIKVTVGLLKKEAQFLNRFFITWITKKRPYVVLKAAMSLDGKITLPGKKTGWITGPQARARVHQIRSCIDAIIVGVNTVIKDNPRLNVRGIRGARQPFRVILDSRLRTPLKGNLWSTRGGPILLATSSRPTIKAKKYESQGAEILFLDRDTKGRVSLGKLLGTLAKREVTSVLVEGGGLLFSSFYDQGLIDELVLHIAPKVFGSRATELFSSVQGNKRIPLSLHAITSYGGDLELRYLR